MTQGWHVLTGTVATTVLALVCLKAGPVRAASTNNPWPSANDEATAPTPSPAITSVSVEGSPVVVRTSDGLASVGDLWFSTWADNDNLYVSWGDGPGFGSTSTDLGIARLRGSLPRITGSNLYLNPPSPGAPDHKPSSLLFLNGVLYGHFHSPAGDPWIGYLAVSTNYGVTWTRAGYYPEGNPAPLNASPWTRATNSPFRCMFFINMGKDYTLNKDGYVYAFGIGNEFSWKTGTVYLARAPRPAILNYDAYEYYTGTVRGSAQWSASQQAAVPVPGLQTKDQASAMYHPGVHRYLFMNTTTLYDAAQPWGPWTCAGTWVRPGWWGYQPGMISKNTGPNSFWFCIAGQPPMGHDISYQLNIGKIVMQVKPEGTLLRIR